MDQAVDERLRDYCVRVIRFLSDSAMDPHLYFEKKLIGDVTVAETTEDLLGILSGLAVWIDENYGPFPNSSGPNSSGPNSSGPGLSGLDRSLGRDGLPTISLLCAPVTRKVGLVLACGRIRTPDESRLVSKLAEDISIVDTDRTLAGRLLADHEQV
jgi:hypothetical protein